MSTIVSSFVQDRASAVQVPTATLVSGVPKAWVQMNQNVSGSQVVIVSFGISGTSDQGVGITNVTFTTPFAANNPIGLASIPAANIAACINSSPTLGVLTSFVSSTGGPIDHIPEGVWIGTLA